MSPKYPFRGRLAMLTVLVAAALVSWKAGLYVARSLNGETAGTRDAPYAALEPLDGSSVTISHHSRTEPVAYTFRLRNVSRSPVRIESAISGCTCTVANLASDKPILPGDVGEVTVQVNSFPSEALLAYQHVYLTIEGEKLQMPLQLCVRLPEPTIARCRPEAISVARSPNPTVRTISLRVPSGCGRVSGQDVQLRFLSQAAAVLTDLSPTPGYNEYAVELTVAPDCRVEGSHGEVRIRTGCGSLLVPVTID